MSDTKIKIKAEDALKDIADIPSEKQLEDSFDKRWGIEACELEQHWARLDGLRSHFKHKEYWSWLLMGMLLFMIAFQSLLLWQVGTKQWDFTEYDWLLPTLMIQYLLQIAGLALIVVKSLFKDMD